MTIYFITPYVVPEDMIEYVNNWVLVSFSLVFLLLTTMSARSKLNMFSILVFGTIIISGMLWWIPKYIPKKDQELAIHIIIVVSTVFLSFVGSVFSLDVEPDVVLDPSDYASLGSGRRKHR
jgi:hypothetical protein